jgi:hypothetical protein
MRALAAAGPHRRDPGLSPTRLRQARHVGRDRPAGARPRPGRGPLPSPGRGPARPWPTPPSWRLARSARPTAQPRQFRAVSAVAFLAPRARALATPSTRLAFLGSTAPLAYEAKAWSGEGHDVGLYQAYALGRIAFPQAQPHPSPSWNPAHGLGRAAGAELSPGPADRDGRDGLVSDAQLETIIYAGEAHSSILPGSWRSVRRRTR